MNGIEEIGERILEIQVEQAAVMAEYGREMEERRDLVFRYCRWGDYQPKPIPRIVTHHLQESIDTEWLQRKGF